MFLDKFPYYSICLYKYYFLIIKIAGQIPDNLIYNKSSYSIVGLKGEGLPSPFDFSLEPTSPHTANWRGFIMTYSIAENRLIVQEMNVTIKTSS